MSRKMKMMDGNTAAAHVAYAFSDVAAIYPITPSSDMADMADRWSAAGRENLFGNKLNVVEMQSEAGAAGAVHGSLQAGALTTTFTASQGLLLMIPNMYKIAGELLPCVIHVSARAIAAHALSIFGDHGDVYACRQTGFAMLASTNPQEVMDLSPIAHLSTLKSRVPFLNFFDGFRTSHEIQKIESWEYDQLDELVDHEDIEAYRSRALNPAHPVQRGTAQNPDIFFQAKEAANPFYNKVPSIVESYMNKVNEKIGTDYKLFNYYGDKEATKVIVAMGSVCDTAEETIDYLMKKGEKVGLIKVRLYRPFSVEHILSVLPKTVEHLAVLDRTKEPGAIGEPLFLDVALSIRGTEFEKVDLSSGRYGLGSKDTTPGQIISVYENMREDGKKRFTMGINDDVTNLSLKIKEEPVTLPEGTTSCKFWGLGADGTVGANKNSIKIIGDHTDMYAQAYFSYDSKKSGGITVSHLRFGDKKIKSTYFVSQADFVACHNPSYINKYDMVQEIKPGGSFLLNCQWSKDELEEHIPNNVKNYIANNNINFYTINGVEIAEEIGLGGRINTILQSAFFNIANIIDKNNAIKYMKDAAEASYGSRGENIVKMNHDAIDKGATAYTKINVPEAWKNASDKPEVQKLYGGNEAIRDYIDNILAPISAQKGDTLPVSSFVGREDGTFPFGSSAFEKRGIAVNVPNWTSENCIQCNFCSYVCPHAVIRPMVVSDEEAKNVPKGTKLMPMTGMAGYQFGMVVSVMDCTGCGSCANVCPGMRKNKALDMEPFETQLEQEAPFLFSLTLEEKPEVLEKFKPTTVKGSQFKQPYLEFSGACAGCGETPYAKLVTQLYGDRMYIANATGCSSIWGGSAPSTPYTTNHKGEGPVWANSLFEDNAEYGFGIYLGQKTLREALISRVEKINKETSDSNLKEAIKGFMDTKEDVNTNKEATKIMVDALQKEGSDLAKHVLSQKDYLAKKSVWMFGGDGWAYDIGYGGLDHVLASNEDVNILVFDTEVYSNTGGQASKATPKGAVAQFAASGKETRKKDIAGMAMTYGYVYVASIAQGANYNQTIKAISEAESHNGPSLIIAYAPCIAHGIRTGMSTAQTIEKNAVQSGYWSLFRFNPSLKNEGKNPFTLDSPAPTASYSDFIMNEVRYSSLERSFPERAQTLFPEAEKIAKERYEYLVKLQKLYGAEFEA